MPRRRLSGRMAALIGAAMVAAATALVPFTANASVFRAPPPAIDASREGGLQTAVLAGGCFWGLEGVFQHVRGVRSVESGYAGGQASDANYAAVSAERTGHAEVVRIIYDPRVVSYGTLLRIFFAVAHDPTQLNRQGPDTGPSYRSAIFAQTPEQARVAEAYIAQLGAARVYPASIVTRIERARFYPAETEHQDFLSRNPRHPYIRRNDLPKVAALRQAFPARFTATAAR